MIWNQINIYFLFLSIPLSTTDKKVEYQYSNETTSSPKGLLETTKEEVTHLIPQEQPSNLLLIPLLIINQRFSQGH